MSIKDNERDRFAERLKEYRKRLLLTQQEFADKIDRPQTVVSSWERGAAMPPANQISTIAKALEVSIEDLCGSANVSGKDQELLDAFHKADAITQKNVRTILGMVDYQIETKGGTIHVENEQRLS